MIPFQPGSESHPSIQPDVLDQLFSREHQHNYVNLLQGRGGLTRRRAEYFVRLWAYLLLKQQNDLNHHELQPLTQLLPTETLVSCTHREAAELFYGQKDRGSDRAAGMMIDQLVALGLLEKRFDGQTLCLRVRPLPELTADPKAQPAFQIKADSFNPRTDAIPVAGLIRQTYAMAADDAAIAPQRIARILRQWADEYPLGLRVLRRTDNFNPVGVSILYPTARETEDIFSRPPGKSFYLTSNVDIDPVQRAKPGDPNCMAVYIRAWLVDMTYLKRPYLCELLKDTQETLRKMQVDFPNLCDLYSPVIHPLYEELRMVLGFQRTCEEHRPFYWIYLSLDRYLELDIEQALAKLQLSDPSGSA
ncbi:hypothetical protein OsccyDRAFT_1153 [Leptolyngbyaceae cyanobacterium JSC-12]|nr:hypothetical protein OsccyDRAFT_1153 [Leptolyngbyaceae cyanobacterium JSC-12]